MKNQIIQTQDRRESCIAFDEEWLMISYEEIRENIELMRYHTESFQKSKTNGYDKIDLSSIKEIYCHENHPEFYLRYQLQFDSEKLKKYYFKIKDHTLRNQFCDELAIQCSLKLKTSKTNRFIGFISNVIILIFSIVFTYIAFHISNGGIVYHRFASVKLVSEILNHINPIVILTLGGIVSLFFVFKITKAFLYPKQSIIYK